MAGSLVTSAATKTMSVTKAVAGVQAMQQYNEKREAEMARAATAMEEARKELIKKKEAHQERKDKHIEERSNKFFAKMVKDL